MPRLVSKLSPRQAAFQIVTVLRQQGHVAYLAGGCVRDELLGVEPKDYDVATAAPPETVRGCFRGSRAVGEAFGVVLVRLGGQAIEVATFRTEGPYSDGRRPDSVAFTDAQHDAQRRDFTINGLFGEPVTLVGGQSDAPPPTTALRVIDYVAGQADLRAGVIRAIGAADQRFAEDYLRMLRAVRFAARFAFQLETQTAAAIRAQARYLGQISRERIGQELRWMFTSPRATLAAQLIQQLHLDGPTLQEDHADPPLPTLAAVDPAASFAVHLAAWMSDRHPTNFGLEQVDASVSTLIRRWRKALCLSNDETEELRQTLTLLPTALSWDRLSLAQRKRLLAQNYWPQTFLLLQALGHRPKVADLAQTVRRQAPPLFHAGVAPQPLVTGDDLIALGSKPGPQFRQILDEVYDLQLEGRLTNRPAALHWLRERTAQAPTQR